MFEDTMVDPQLLNQYWERLKKLSGFDSRKFITILICQANAEREIRDVYVNLSWRISRGFPVESNWTTDEERWTAALVSHLSPQEAEFVARGFAEHTPEEIVEIVSKSRL